MSEAPERIWATLGEARAMKKHDSYVRLHEYLRSDLAGLPEELVAKAREAISGEDEPNWTLAVRAVIDLLAWHEQQEKL